MKVVFADTVYWVALSNLNDQWYGAAVEVSRGIRGTGVVTTEEVLVETLNVLSRLGPGMRRHAAELIDTLQSDPWVTVVPQSSGSFAAGLSLYRRRLDKRYSLTDCISMQTMREQRISEVLTHDHHFEQEGFVALLRR